MRFHGAYAYAKNGQEQQEDIVLPGFSLNGHARYIEHKELLPLFEERNGVETIKYQEGPLFIYIPKEIEHLIGKVIFRPNGAYVEDKQGRPMVNGK